MKERFYTLAEWQVKEGQEEEFVHLWREELATAFMSANPAAQGTLVQSLETPQRFYSFGPWESLEQMQAARSDAAAQEAIAKLIALCDHASPGPYRVVARVP